MKFRKPGVSARMAHEREEALKRAMERIRQEETDDEESEKAFRWNPFDVMSDCDDDEYEGSTVEELAHEIAEFAAERAAEKFAALAEDMDLNTVVAMLCLIEYSSPLSGVKILKGMFYARSMDDAAQELDIIVRSSIYCEDVCEIFIENFIANDDIDWFYMERTLQEVS